MGPVLGARPIIEAPGYVDGNGLTMGIVGDLPLGCAAVCSASISVQRMAVQASINGDVNLLKQAMMMDPLTGAVCNPPEIWQMTDEMLVALEPWLPQYASSMPTVRARMAGPLIPTIENQGASRLHTKTIEEMEAKADENRKLAEESDKAKVRPAAATAE